MASAQRAATRQATRMEHPVIRQILRQRNQFNKQQQQRETNAEGFAQALAHMLGGIGGATASEYSNAAGSTAAFSKGLSDAEQHMAGDENASLGSFLQKAGISPGAAATALGKVGSPAATDVLYGTTGYAPAAGLEREGAAFTAAADKLPAWAGGQGLQELNLLENDRQKQDQVYENEAAAERAKIPTLAQQILQTMASNARSDQSLAIQKSYLNQRSRAAQQAATGVDPVTGSTKPGYYQDKGGHVLPVGYVWRHGHPVRTSSASKSPYDFNKAMSEANSHVYTAAKALVKTVKSTDPLAGVDANHPATITQHPPYVKAAKVLFNEYKYLLREVPRSGRPRAKRILTSTIRQALIAAGIKPTKGQQSNVPQQTHPGPNY